MHPAAQCSQISKTSLLAFVIANAGIVSLNAPWGLVTSHQKSLAGVSSTTISTLIFFYLNVYTYHDNSHEILIQLKIDGLNFGEFMVIRQIRQCFPPPKFPSIQYTLY